MPVYHPRGGAAAAGAAPRVFQSGMSVKTGDLVIGNSNYVFRRTGPDAVIASTPMPNDHWTPVSGTIVCRVHIQTGAPTQTVSSNGNPNIRFDSYLTSANTENWFVIAAEGITVPVAGLYRVRGQVAFATSSLGTRRGCGVGYKRGASSTASFSDYFFAPPNAGLPTTVATETVMRLERNDIINLVATQDSSSDLNLHTGTHYFNVLQAEFLGT